MACTAIHSVMNLENKQLNAETTGKKQEVNVTPISKIKQDRNNTKPLGFKFHKHTLLIRQAKRKLTSLPPHWHKNHNKNVPPHRRKKHSQFTATQA